jgi:hypothetical protein
MKPADFLATCLFFLSLDKTEEKQCLILMQTMITNTALIASTPVLSTTGTLITCMTATYITSTPMGP